MIKTRHRNIPQTMGTQHPDNAHPPFWESDGDGFVSIHEEVAECASSFEDLGCEEYMWDWEGKHVDEGVIEKMLSEHYDFFSKHQIGKDCFLTFRIPNIWEEGGHSLARAFMNMLTAERFAKDMNLFSPPLFEMILPMADSAAKMIEMQKTFTQLADFKHQLFKDTDSAFNYVEMIPLIEEVHAMESVSTLLDEYVKLHKQYYKNQPPYMRVFFARSDPALVAGMVPAILGNKIGLSELYQWSAKTGIDVYPWIGAGSLPFRGHLRPDTIDYFLKTYPGIRSVTIQSSFRYDFPKQSVKRAIKRLNTELKLTKPVIFSEEETKMLKHINTQFEAPYQKTIHFIANIINEIAEHVPSRRERRLHIGLLSYGRKVGTKKLPRAITFTAALYSLGIPPELIGTGRGLLASLSPKELALFEKQYSTFAEDLMQAGQYLNIENLAFLAKDNRGFKDIQKDVEILEAYLGTTFGPRSSESFIHRNWTSTVYFQRKKKKEITESIVASAKIRQSLG